MVASRFAFPAGEDLSDDEGDDEDLNDAEANGVYNSHAHSAVAWVEPGGAQPSSGLVSTGAADFLSHTDFCPSLPALPQLPGKARQLTLGTLCPLSHFTCQLHATDLH